jgi:hydroxypyruvate isomerase
MPRFSANISMLFLEHALLDRPAAAAAAGFPAIEIQFPYEAAAEDWAAAIQAAGVKVAVFNFPIGDLLTGGPGLASMPGRQAAFQAAVAEGARYADLLKPLNVNVLAGWPPADLGRAACLEALAENLAFAAAQMADRGMGVTVEAVNTRDRPGYFLSTTDQALDAVTRAGAANLGLEHDFYHMQIMEGDLVPTLERALPRIRHLQFADTPGRHEPGTGEINFPFLFAAIDRLGYAGYVGAEYVPTGRTEATLGWMKPYL